MIEFHHAFFEGYPYPEVPPERYAKMRKSPGEKAQTILVTRMYRSDPYSIEYADESSNFTDSHFREGDERYAFKNTKKPAEPREPSARLQNLRDGVTYQGFVQDEDCTGSNDPLLLLPKIVNGIRLECDGQCYDISGISNWYLSGNHTAPTRAVFTDRDIARMEAYIEHNKPPGGGRRKRRTTRTTRKNKKSKKSKRTRRRQ